MMPDHRISQGMKVEMHSYGYSSPVSRDVVMVREGIIGRRVRWEKRWAEYALLMDAKGLLSITILVPLEWLQMSLIDRFQHYRERHLLLDVTPGPFPQYNKGEVQMDYGYGRRIKHVFL